MRCHVLQRLLRTASTACLATVLLLSACRTVPPQDAVPLPAPIPAPPAPSAPIVAAAPKPSLAEEQRRLAALFRGTPVGFVMQRDGSLRVNVPLRYCFDAGQFKVKPPLEAVLEHLAMSQEDSDSRIAVSIPGDTTARRDKARREAGARLSHQRAISLRDYLSNKGIADSRVTVSATAGAAASRGGVTVVVIGSPEP